MYNVVATATKAKPRNKRLRELQLILMRQQRADIYALMHMYGCGPCGCCKHQKPWHVCISTSTKPQFVVAKEFQIAAFVGILVATHTHTHTQRLL